MCEATITTNMASLIYFHTWPRTSPYLQDSQFYRLCHVRRSQFSSDIIDVYWTGNNTQVDSSNANFCPTLVPQIEDICEE